MIRGERGEDCGLRRRPGMFSQTYRRGGKGLDFGERSVIVLG